MKTNDKSWIWTCYDCSDDVAKIEKLAGRFTSKEGKENFLFLTLDFEKFEKEFNDAFAHNTKLVAEKKEAQPEEKKEDDKPQATASTDDKKVEEAK